MIQKDEFMTILKEIDVNYGPEELEVFFKDFDSNNDSVISFFEFLHILKGVVPEDKKKK
jgi:Ca2+-binding EF-hand superfamily protein